MFNQHHLDYNIKFFPTNGDTDLADNLAGGGNSGDYEGSGDFGDPNSASSSAFLVTSEYIKDLTNTYAPVWPFAEDSGVTPFQEDSVDAVYQILKFTDYFR
jgi:hypothetical protein